MPKRTRKSIKRKTRGSYEGTCGESPKQAPPPPILDSKYAKSHQPDNNMLVPNVITSDSFDNSDNLSLITMNERDENATVFTATPTVLNPNKRRRVIVEPALTEEESLMQPKLSPGGWGTSTGCDTKLPPSPAAASFGVPIADFRDCNATSALDTTRHSFEDLSIELCKIVATEHYSRTEAIQALGNFCQWGYADDAVFLENFLELGGIQRVLIYLRNNQGDPHCVAMASKVIMACTFRTPSQKSYNAANDIVRALAKRNGIQALLDACGEYRGENMSTQLSALRWIWAALMNITDKSAAYESPDPIAHKDQLMTVFEAGLDGMAKLGRNACAMPSSPAPHQAVTLYDASKQTNGTDTSSVYQSGRLARYNAIGGADYQLKAVQWIFSSLCGGAGSRKRAAMEMIVTDRHGPVSKKESKGASTTIVPRKATTTDNSKMASVIMDIIVSTWLNIAHNSMLTRDDFLGMNFLRKCIEALKSPNTGEWIPQKELLIQASRFFVRCHQKKIISTSDDFEVVFPLIVECIGTYPDAANHVGLLDFVKDAYSVLDRSFLQGSGVVRAIATAWESNDVDEATKTASHQLLKELL
mmetsp:Transcript_21910/g.52133  ORF Transcript_21910/g.52133 Transcript_21910/m.52133 type:complete len:587 (-) Transcript_21910:114-1874(-)